MRTARFLIAAAALVCVGALAPAQAAGPTIDMSTFRSCPARAFPCDPLDIGYVSAPGSTSPAVEQYSPITTVKVKAGDVVTWTYNDSACDAIQVCPGHDVGFTNSALPPTSTGSTITKHAITWTVPAGLAAGTYLPYYCSLHAPFGMNGALQIAS